MSLSKSFNAKNIGASVVIGAIHATLAGAFAYAAGTPAGMAAVMGLSSAAAAQALGLAGLYAGMSVGADNASNSNSGFGGVLTALIGGIFLAGVGATGGYAVGTAVPFVVRALVP